MLSFECKDIGIDCDFKATHNQYGELMKQVMEHGSTVHADLMKDFTPQQAADFAAKVEQAIKYA